MSYTIDVTLTTDSTADSSELVVVKVNNGSTVLDSGYTDIDGDWGSTTLTDAVFDVYTTNADVVGAADGESITVDLSSSGPDELVADPTAYAAFPSTTNPGSDPDLATLMSDVSSFKSSYDSWLSDYTTFETAYHDSSFPDINSMPTPPTEAPAWPGTINLSYTPSSPADVYAQAIISWYNGGAYDMFVTDVANFVTSYNGYFGS